MVVALLVVLGVDLVVVVVLGAGVVSRKRWVRSQPGAFEGAIHVTEGEVHGLKPAWSHGYGRWVHDVLVWSRAPLYFRNEVLAVDAIIARRAAASGEIKKLGDAPTVVRLTVAEATVELAAAEENDELLLGPYPETTGPDPADTRT
jgi:hypothetical protein